MKKQFRRRVMLPMATVIVLSGTALASGEGSGSATSGITSAVTTGLQQVQSDAMSLIGSVLPYALTVMGAVLVINIGLKVFKRVTGR